MVLDSNTYIDISPYHEILSGMNFILSISVGVVKLTGPAGTGKTRLLQQLETELQAERQETLLFLTAPASIKELHDTITRRLKLDNEFGFNKALIHHIVAKPYDQQRLVIMFDNAELIDIDVLLAIALFRNIMHNGQPIVSIVLCGSEALNTKLADSSYRPLVQDMLLSYELHPLTREQLQAYGQACADIHRLGKLPLKNGVLTELLRESKGLPGAVPELLKKIRENTAATVDATAPVVAAPVAAPEPAPAPKAKAPFRLFGKRDKADTPAKVEPVISAAAPVKAEPVITPAAPVKAEPVITAAAPVKAKPVSTTQAPAVAATLAAKRVKLARTEAAAKTPVATPDAMLDADARLILASRAEKEAIAARRAAAWQRYKPALQGTAVAAGLVAVVILAWPRLAPTVSDLYASLTREAPVPTPPAEPAAPAPVDQVPPAELAVEQPAPAEPAPADVAVTPAPQTPAPSEPAVPVDDVPAPPAAEPAPQVAVTPPAPTPAAPQTPRLPTPAANANPDDLEQVIRNWLMAWQAQDVDNFFSYYHTDFAPLYQDTLAAWRADRQTKITRPASIMIELDEFMVGPSSRLGTRVSFWMTYESPNYADRTLKEVLIGQDLDGQWRILQEYNQQTTPITPSLLTSNPASTAPGPQRTRIATNAPPPRALPGPVQPPQPASRANLSQDQIDGIARFLAAWLTAWQNQDVDEYFRHYEPAYKPDSMASAQQWRNDRIAKISRPQRIVLRMDELEILAGDEANVRVQLVLEYHSTHYADRTVKEIELRKGSSGDWLIAEEKNRAVEPLPLMRLLPVDGLAYLVMR